MTNRQLGRWLMSAISYHRLGKSEFERRHNLDVAELVRRFNRLWFHPHKNYLEGR